MRQPCVHAWGTFLLLGIALPGVTPAASEDRATPAVAVPDLRVSAGLPADLVPALTASLRESLEGLGALALVDATASPASARPEQVAGAPACAGGGCPPRTGGGRPPDYLVLGSVAFAEGRYLVQLQLVKAADGRLENRVFRDYTGSAEGLSRDVGIAARILVRELVEAPAGRVVLLVSEPGAIVRVDGTIVGSSPLGPLSLTGGLHTVEIGKEGFARFRRDFLVEGGTDVVLGVHLVRVSAGDAGRRPGAGAPRALAWGSFALGAVGLAGGGALYAASSSRAKTLERDISTYNASTVRTPSEADALTRRRSELARLNAAAVGSAGLGVAGIVAGVLLFRWDAHGRAPGDAGEAPATAEPLGIAATFPGVTLRVTY